MLKKAYFLKVVYFLSAVLFAYFVSLKIIALFSTGILLSAGDAAFDSKWAYHPSSYGLSEDYSILRTEKKGAKAKIKFIISKEGEYVILVRFRGGPSSGKIELIFDGTNKYFVNQRGPDEFVWRRGGKIKLEEGSHILTIINPEDEYVIFDSVYLTNNFFFKPKVNRFNTDVIDNRTYNAIFNLLSIMIYSLTYLGFIYLLSRSKNFSGRFHNFISIVMNHVRTNPSSLFAFMSIILLVMAYFRELNGNLESADIVAVYAYVSFVVGIITTIVFLNK